MQEALEILVQVFVLFYRHLDLIQVLEGIRSELEVQVKVRGEALAVLQLFLVFRALFQILPGSGFELILLAFIYLSEHFTGEDP